MNLRTLLAGTIGLALAAGASAKSIAVQMPKDTEFSVDLYKQLATTEGNVFFSPFSIDAALAMTAGGARGETAAEMMKTLHLSGPEAHVGMGDILATLTKPPAKQSDEGRFQLEVASALWGQKQYPFNDAFLKLARDTYKAEAQSLDFSDPEASRKTINDWVTGKTHDKIKDLIGPGAITNDTRLVLTNAVYFKAQWAEQFSKSATTDQPFFVAPEKPQNVPMMRESEHLGYSQDESFHAVGLRYAGGTTTMFVLVPKAVDGLAKAEAALTAKSLEALIAGNNRKLVDLSLPRFSFEFAATLRKPLEAMGIKRAFDPQQADFSGMTTAEKLAITDVLHKAFVKVDEDGTEAAAATAVVMGVMSAPMEPEKPIEVKADRPFLIVIRHNETGVILFMGRVAKPEGVK